jgi:anaerobic magnesium-protoporphyrin IX monomethyl ester cyclase
MSKVALVNPGPAGNANYGLTEPHNLGYLASYLEQHDVEVCIVDQLAGDDVMARLESFDPDWVGFSGTTPVAMDAYDLADECRKRGWKTVMGGVHASIMVEEALQHVEVVVKGEGEQALLKLVRGEVEGPMVQGEPVANLDDLPPVARHLMNMEHYLSNANRHPFTFLAFVPPNTPSASLLTARGCPRHCIFCHNSWRGIPYRANTPERVVSELKALQADYGVKALFFIEDNFFAVKRRMKSICELMQQEKIKLIWGATATASSVNEETLEAGAAAGLKQVTFGFESGSQRIHEILGKGVTVEQCARAARMCKEVGITVNATFMIGSPTETREDIEMTLRFIEDNPIDVVGLLLLTPYPGTQLWDWLIERGFLLESRNWRTFDFSTVMYSSNGAMSRDEILQTYREALDRIYRPKASTYFFSKLQHPLEGLKTAGKVITSPKRVLQRLKTLRW